MSIIQLSLFEEMELDYEKHDSVGDINAKNSYIEATVSAYRILDKLTNRSYIGVSIDPATRLSTHKKGKTSNKELNKLMNERPDDVQFEIIDEFFDPTYKSNDSESRASKIEAFLIQVYDSIQNGMNSVLIFHHDYTDVSFWKDVLTPKLFDIYLVANHELLNIRSQKNKYLKVNSRKNNKPDEKEYKKWASEYLVELESKGIKTFVLAQKLSKIDRRNLYRFIRQEDYGAISARKLSLFLTKLEKHLNIPHKAFPMQL